MDNSADPTLESLVYSYLMDKCTQLRSCAKKFRKVMGSAPEMKSNSDLECYVNAGRQAKKRKVQDLSDRHAAHEVDNNKRIKLTPRKKTQNKSQVNNKKCSISSTISSSSTAQNVSSSSHLIKDETLTNILSPICEIEIKSNRNTEMLAKSSKQSSKQSTSGDIAITESVNNYSDDSSEEEIPKSFSPIADKNSTDEELPSNSKINYLKSLEIKRSDNISIKHDKETPTSDVKKKHTRKVKQSEKKQRDLSKPKKKKN